VDVPARGRLTIVLVLLLLPFPLEIGGFLVGEHLLAGQLARPLERRQRPEIPCALKVRLSVRCSWNGLARALRRLAREVCRGRQCQDRTRNDQCTWKNGESAAHHDLLFELHTGYGSCARTSSYCTSPAHLTHAPSSSAHGNPPQIGCF